MAPHQNTKIISKMSAQKFLQFLDRHFRTLQYLSQSAPLRWEGGLQDEVAQLRRRGLERATTMQEILQVRNKTIKTGKST